MSEQEFKSRPVWIKICALVHHVTLHPWFLLYHHGAKLICFYIDKTATQSARWPTKKSCGHIWLYYVCTKTPRDVFRAIRADTWDWFLKLHCVLFDTKSLWRVSTRKKQEFLSTWVPSSTPALTLYSATFFLTVSCILYKDCTWAVTFTHRILFVKRLKKWQEHKG